MEEDARCRLLLGLQEGHSEEQLRQAYHDVVKVWHPDRFPHDERLRGVAQEKLKEINGAYEFLRAKLFEDSLAPHCEAPSDSQPHAPKEPIAGTRHSGWWTICEVLGLALLAAGLFFFVNSNNSRRNAGPAREAAPVFAPVKGASPALDAAGWEVLFDGKSVEHWRGFRQEDFPDQNWEIRNSALQSTEGAERVDLITRDEYLDFELELEWRISTGGNSGILYHVSEDADEPWKSGPEMQIIDDDRNLDGREPKTSAGSLFGVIAPVNKHLNPVGEWNQTRISVAGHHVEYWLNGAMVVHYELESDEFKALVAKSQFRDDPIYARQRSGRIDLQSNYGQVAFRNIRIRRLASSPTLNEP